MKLSIPTIQYPISEVIPAIQQQLAEHNTLLISAPPGAGKSTVLPIALSEEKWLGNQKIIMLEPRRLAARSIAERMSELTGQSVGQGIGYRIRFENKVSDATRIEVVTEGILTRLLQSDNSLEGVGMVIFDEFHERSLFADESLALCREVQQILRPELHIVIMSATLDLTSLSTQLKAPVIESPGRLYPVDIRYVDTFSSLPVAEATAKVIMQAVKEENGDVLAFLPGENEIRQCEEWLQNRLNDSFAIHPLYSLLSHHEQTAAIRPNQQGKRKIVLATSIAETSLTIEGIRIVVDSGLARTQRYNPNTALSRLETDMISNDRAEQRAGRAGRLSDGICYRLWSRATQQRLKAHRTPEMEESDLSALVLDIAQWGVTQINDMEWVTPPPLKAVSQAYQLLEQLEALSDGKITSIGRQMNQLPCHPRIAHMLIRSKEIHSLALATDLAALLEERDPLAMEGGTDINKRIEALRRYRQKSGEQIPAKWNRIEKAAASYRRQFKLQPDNGPVDVWQTGVLLAFAYPERIAHSIGNGLFQFANSVRARIDLSDDMAHEEWIAAAHLDSREGTGKIFLASPLQPDDLLPFAVKHEQISWDTRKGGLQAQQEMRYGKTVIKVNALTNVNADVVKNVLCDAIHREGEQLLDFNEAVVQWQNRVSSLRVWQPDGEWPDVSTATLLADCETWLLPYLDGKSKVEELKRINLKEALQYHLPYEQQQLLDQLAPATIQVPSSSHIRLQYFPDARQPILAVRLQECFGMATTPRLCNGKISVVMHFLSPGFKPVQITSDVESFWNNTYFEIRKELKRRYPKHVWPDNPWEEQAIRGIKKSGNKDSK